MDKQQEQLVKLVLNNWKPAREIEDIHGRCCIFYHIDEAMQKCQEIICFATAADIGLLESFRLQVEIDLLMIRV